MLADFDAIVVGAGPAGSRVARDLALDGWSVLVLEQHRQIGFPCHCSGLVTPRTLEVADCGPGLVLNAIKGAVLREPSGRPLRLTSDTAQAYAIDRIEMDRRLARQAQDAGAVVRLDSRFVDFEVQDSTGGNGGRVSVRVESSGRQELITGRLIVGADGANSKVAKQIRGPGDFRVVRGLGANARYHANEHPDHVEIFLDDESAPGWFGWTIPLSAGNARLGTGSANGLKPIESLERLRQRFPDSLGSAEITSKCAGGIAVWEPMKTVADRVLLIGDAARQAKPTSGGGILTALVSAEIAAQACIQALIREDLSSRSLRVYPDLWEKRLGRELKRQHDMRRAFSRLDARRLAELVTALSRTKTRSSIESTGDIDFPSRLVWRLLTRHPGVVFRTFTIPRFPAAWLTHPAASAASAEARMRSVR